MSQTMEEVNGKLEALVEKLEGLHRRALRGDAPSALADKHNAEMWEADVLEVFNLAMTIKPSRASGRRVRQGFHLLEQALHALAMEAHYSIPTRGWARELRPSLRLARRIQRDLRVSTTPKIDPAAEAWLRRQLDGLTGGA